MRAHTSTTLTGAFWLLLSPLVVAQEKAIQEVTHANEHEIIQASSSKFTGAANFAHYPVMPSNGNVAPAIVHFEANTITNWHVHPFGQYLIVTEGEGRTQQWDKPIEHIKKDDVIWCPPGVKHWHGASENSTMSHIAISPVATDGQSVTWLEKVVLPESVQRLPTASKKEANVSLSPRQLSLIPIAGSSATGDMLKLEQALINGLDSGLTVNEIKEAFAHQYAYAGFPRSLNGMLALKTVLEQRIQDGIVDELGATPTALPETTDYYQLGNETLAYLNKIPLEQSSRPLFDNFSPTIDHALKSHLFGYLFSKDNLGFVERELVVIATLSVLGNVNGQLRSHLRIAKNLGLAPSQMEKIITTLEKELGTEVAQNTQSVLLQLK